MMDKEIPLYVHEGVVARMDRSCRRTWIIAIIAIVMLFLTNALWLYEWMQYDYVSEDYGVSLTSDEGNANYIGHDGDIENAGNDYR